MGNGIMNMQEVEVVIFYHVHHRTCQRCFVGREIKQGIGRHLYFVVKYIGNKTIQPYRLLVSDKMHMMAFLRKRLAEFCSQYSRAAKSGITNNSNSHNIKYGSYDHPKVTVLPDEGLPFILNLCFRFMSIH